MPKKTNRRRRSAIEVEIVTVKARNGKYRMEAVPVQDNSKLFLPVKKSSATKRGKGTNEKEAVSSKDTSSILFAGDKSTLTSARTTQINDNSQFVEPSPDLNFLDNQPPANVEKPPRAPKRTPGAVSVLRLLLSRNSSSWSSPSPRMTCFVHG